MAVGYLQGNIASSDIFTVLSFYRLITVSTWHSEPCPAAPAARVQGPW